MYAVIFQAEIMSIDEKYQQYAKQLRELAMNRYNCLEFVSRTENNKEIAISYWQTEKDIQQWKQDEQHQLAQAKARQKWYKNYRVQIVEVCREYSFNG